MIKEEYIKIIEDNKELNTTSKQILLNQIDNYYLGMSNNIKKEKYNKGDKVKLKKGTLLHGTYKNIKGLKEIVKNGLISSWFVYSKGSKYPSSVGVWNLKKDYYLKEYIDFYSGGTVRYTNHNNDKKETEVIPYSGMKNFIEKFSVKNYLMWQMEQTKEARFLPSLVQDVVQIGIIINGNNKYIKELLKNDILNPSNINDKAVKEFVNPSFYEAFIQLRKNKDDFFTDRESAILFGIPSNMIEGILVGRKYEKEENILKEIKTLLPDAYICNLDGIVIVGNNN